VPIVNNFLRAGYEVAIMHSGAHEADFDAPVEHIHGDARDAADIAARLGSREWEVAVCTSGRLRALAEHLAGKTRRLVAITGQPVYRGSLQPTPRGTIALPVPEYAERQYDATGYTGRVAEGEDQLFRQHGAGDFEAVILRYPGVFGPRAPMNHEWAVVRRVIDKRAAMVLPHDGMACFQRGYVENLAWLVWLAATRPEAAGQAFNAGDERVLSARRVAEVILEELGWQMEFVGVPAQFCRGFYPLAEKSNMVLDMSKARNLLGYRDAVDVEEATRRTARWLLENPPDAADLRPAASGSFDYEREDALIAAWKDAATAMAPFAAPRQPQAVGEGA
jgi:nucleoside-diphosphate-sugar epimerase